jgi:hypoxanthine phosphoribosyltransferase
MTSDKTIKLHDRTFRMMIPEAELDAAVGAVAARINADYAGRERPLFLGVLNGAFMFASDLAKKMEFPLEVSFVKLASYSGLSTTGRVEELIGLGTGIEGRHVIVVEDVVDTGESMEHLLRLLAELRPASVEVAAMFFKPGAFRKSFPVKYRGIEVGNDFIIGYGLDYNGLGRNLKDIYVVEDE